MKQIAGSGICSDLDFLALQNYPDDLDSWPSKSPSNTSCVRSVTSLCVIRDGQRKEKSKEKYERVT